MIRKRCYKKNKKGRNNTFIADIFYEEVTKVKAFKKLINEAIKEMEDGGVIVKQQFEYAKVVYRGIAKNMNRFHILFASANLLKCFRAGRAKDFCMV